jgi:dihydroorotate dehydrogenase (fumarate)
MADLSCTFLGLTLKNPVVLECNTENIEEIVNLAGSGIGAIILKPIFEEILNNEALQVETLLSESEAGNDISKLLSDSISGNYLSLIFKLKKTTSIPIIASVDCVSDGAWIEYARLIEYAGADAIQLTIFSFPDDKDFRSNDYEKSYFEIATKFTYDVKIPVYLSTVPQYTNMLYIVDQLFYRGIQGIALFCNYGSRDIDINEFECILVDDAVERNNFYLSLKWIGIISSIIRKLDLTAFCNSVNYEDVIKYILSGANAVIIKQKYLSHTVAIKVLLNEINNWMERAGFSKIEHFHGQMNYQEPVKLSIHEREVYLKGKSNNDF